MDVRLPVFGKAAPLNYRDKKSILNKGYLLIKNQHRYTSQRNRGDIKQSNQLSSNGGDPTSALDNFSDHVLSPTA